MAKAKTPAAQPAQKANTAKKETTAVAVAPDDMFRMFGGSEQSGFEGTDKDSFAIPFLRVLQPMSPAVVDQVAGAKPGALINTVTGQVYEEIKVIPCAFTRRYLQWAPRNSGGGFRGELTVSQYEILKSQGKIKRVTDENDKERESYNGNYLSDTRAHYCILVDGPADEIGKPCVLAMASSQIKISKRWVSVMKERMIPNGHVIAPTFSSVYTLKTLKQKNDQGTWWLFDLGDNIEWVANPGLYRFCEDFGKQVNAGAVTVRHDDLKDDGEDAPNRDNFQPDDGNPNIF